ncbi:HAD-IA family hydrolase [Enterococcus hulanensis]|uniref:HAD-IA family hydrolase n=1 Tax=Enterococcus hulanensis TaxID=2559929 RepID=UPI001A8F18EC|nr:HAD-IA family hydrolase [Enterococcus hulanensis]MBO0457837.1 HAD-IA family hydrolase [Enterococcus hulanensis]MDT2658291.1 HAD-IA family hydrolase [Enterococcus hulanensis]
MNYIWDFDGTLYDTYPIMLKALMRTFKEFDINKDEETVYKKIKMESIRQMIVDWQLPAPDFDQNYHAYEAQQNKASYPFEETKETLEKLQDKGGQHFILTHRTVESTWNLLKRDGLDALIVDIIGSDSNYPRKPDPSAINYFIDNYQLDRNKTVMIGDRKLDIEAGNNADVQTVFFDIDYFKQDIKSAYFINNLKEMVQIF